MKKLLLAFFLCFAALSAHAQTGKSALFIYSCKIINMVMSFLSFAIEYVISVCSNKQMIWTYAWRIVAMMANQQSFRDWTKVQFPRNAMSFYHSSWIGSMDTAIVSVFSNKTHSCPNPTGFSFLDFAPKSLRERSTFDAISRRAVALKAAIFSRSPWIDGGKIATAF